MAKRKALACQWGQGEDTAYGGQFLSGMTTHDTRLTEQRLYGGVAGGNGTRMTRRCTTAALTAASFDSCDAASLADQTAGMEEQFVRIGDILNVEQLDE